MKEMFYRLNTSVLSRFITNCLPEELIEHKNEGQNYEEFEKIYNRRCQNNEVEFKNISKYEFLDYLVENKSVLLHGSKSSIEGFIEPKSIYENKQLLFSSKNILHAMVHAFRDISKKSRNPVYSGQFIVDKQFDKRFPFISINNQVFTQQGYIYVLPSQSFKRITHYSRIFKMTNGRILNIHSQQWVSHEPVKPLMKINISVKDLPFGYALHNEREPYMSAMMNYEKRNKKEVAI